MSFDNFLYECWSTVQYDTLKFLLFCCRVKEVITSGLDRFVYDPDKATTLRLLQEHVRTLPTVTTPPLEQWTDCLDGVPRKYNYMSVVEYLVKREVKILQVSELNQQMPVPLPVADKPLVKGYNFFASGHVGEILVNSFNQVFHIRTTVLASMREERYDVTCALDEQTGLVITATCKCVAGLLGKCNHVAGLLFAMLDYVMTIQNPDSCTNRPQVWHQPKSRKRKRATRPTVIGKRKVAKHVYGRVTNRKGPLEDYSQYQAISNVVKPDSTNLKAALKVLSGKHDTGLLQVLDSSTDSALSDDLQDELQENLTPEEVVVQRMQVILFRPVDSFGNHEVNLCQHLEHFMNLHFKNIE